MKVQCEVREAKAGKAIEYDLKGGPLFRDEEAFAQLYKERVPYYRLADFRISTEGRKPEEVVEQILSLQVF